MGASETAWPAPGATHPLLPPEVQRETRMPHASPQLDWELAQAMTTRLITSAGEVHFSYESEGESKEVLHGVSLTVARGEVVALVGPSGAGKSTLMNLLPRFFDVTGGAIFLDGHDATIRSLRSRA